MALFVLLAQKDPLDLSLFVSHFLPFTVLPSLLCPDPVLVTFAVIDYQMCWGVCARLIEWMWQGLCLLKAQVPVVLSAPKGMAPVHSVDDCD